MNHTLTQFLCGSLLIAGTGQLVAEQLGRSAILDAYFEYNPVTHDLVRITAGTEATKWPHPEADQIVQIETGSALEYQPDPADPKSETLVQTQTFFPVALTNDGSLFRGDAVTRSWTLVGSVPTCSEKLSGGEELLASQVLTPRLLLWACGQSVAISTDLGSTWKLLGTLPSNARRVVVTGDLDLVVITHNGMAVAGKVEKSGVDRYSWTPAIEALPVAGDDTVLYSGPHTYSISSNDGSQRQLWRAKHGPIGSGEPSNYSSAAEYSSRNLSPSGCQFDVYRRTASSPWLLDNHWDFSFRRSEMDLDYRLRKGDRNNCIWLSPFRAVRFEIRTSNNSQQVFSGRPGRYRFVAYENPSSYGVVRAFALHIEDIARYPKHGPLRLGPNDKWAIVVQQGNQGNLTACQVFAEAQRQSSGGRPSLSIPVKGSNRSCPISRSTSIACVSQDARSAAQSAFNGLGLFAESPGPHFSGGSGECLLPELP